MRQCIWTLWILVGVVGTSREARSQTPFIDVTALRGVAVVHTGHLVDDEPIGSGAAWFDYDRDGDLDLYMTQRLGANHLFRNNGDGTFTDVAAELGADDAAHDGAGVAVADYDNDGDLDIYLANSDEDVLLRNEGGAGFTDVTASAFGGIVLDQRGTSASWGDYDRDGYLDLYVTHHQHVLGEELDRQDRLFRNNGDGTFSDMTSLMAEDVDGDGIDDLSGKGFIGAWTDYDDDGDLDLFLVNDCPFGPENTKVFRNDNGASATNWLFTEVSAEVRADHCRNGMGIAIGDFNRDALFDYFYTNITESILLKNLGDSFVNATRSAGLDLAKVPETGDNWVTWGANFIDYDLDGWPDLFVAAGSLKPSVEDYPQPNQLWHNNGDGTFTYLADSSGVDDVAKGRTSVYGDYDGDGDADLFLVNYGGEAHLYENVEANATGHHWLIVDLEGVASNRDGIGARVTVETNDGVVQVAETHSGTSLGGGDDLGAYFGLGTATGVDRLEVRWPSGLVQVLEAVAVDQRLTVVESGLLAELRPLTWPIEIGASGGSFSYRLGVTNLTGASVEVDVWLHIEGPEGVSITRGPIHRTLGGGASLGLTGSQNVPGGAPSGSYTMTLKVGTFPIAEQTASFSFSKVGTSRAEGGAADVRDWAGNFEGGMRDAQARSWRGRRVTSPLLRLASPPAVPDDPVRGIQVYPTPFRSQTTIRYWLESPAHIRLELYDVLGRRVQRIVDEEQAVGVHDVQVSGEGLPPGTYFYRMEAGRRVHTGTLQRLR